jgi:hypothetical protein
MLTTSHAFAPSLARTAAFTLTLTLNYPITQSPNYPIPGEVSPWLS